MNYEERQCIRLDKMKYRAIYRQDYCLADRCRAAIKSLKAGIITPDVETLAKMKLPRW